MGWTWHWKVIDDQGTGRVPAGTGLHGDRLAPRTGRLRWASCLSPDGSIRLAEPAWARDLAIAGRGILFLDEITTAPPAVQAALLRVVLERVVGDLALPDDVAVVAAADPPELAAGGWDLTPPLANRFCHLEWPVDFDRFLEALSAGWSPPETVRTPESGADEAGVQIRATLAGFLRSRPALLYAVPDDISSSGRAWPSPRTWEMAARLWSAAEASNQDDAVALSLLAGCVGPGAARELMAWQKDADLPDPEKVLVDPSSFRLPERGDRRFAVLSAIAAAVVRNPTKERWEAAFLGGRASCRTRVGGCHSHRCSHPGAKHS